MTISNELLHQRLGGVERPEDLRGDQADLPGDPQFRKDGNLRQGEGCYPQSVRYCLPGTVQQMTRFSTMG
ncbi:MAG: hypothetical protein HRU33_04790 [Rhodobacteraceae bacterium]|nr:hypothetical protein [Paracoccaceae bacterium]